MAEFVVQVNYCKPVTCRNLMRDLRGGIIVLLKLRDNRHGPKIGGGGSAPFSGREARSPSNTVTWAKAYLHTKWHLNPSSHLIWAKNWRGS